MPLGSERRQVSSGHQNSSKYFSRYRQCCVLYVVDYCSDFQFFQSPTIIIVLLWEFFTPTLADSFHWSLTDSKSSHVSRTLLSILSNLSNTVVRMVSTLGIILSASITNCITFIFHSFFSSLARSRYSSLFSPSFDFTLWSTGTAKSSIQQFSFFWLTITRSVPLAEIRWSVWISKSQRQLCAFPSLGRFLGCAYTTSLYGQISVSCTISSRSLPPPSRVLSNTRFELIFWIHLLHDWSFPLYHNITYMCYFVVSSISALTSFGLMALFCAVISRDSVSLFRFPFLSCVQVFSYEICRLKYPFNCFFCHVVI